MAGWVATPFIGFAQREWQVSRKAAVQVFANVRRELVDSCRNLSDFAVSLGPLALHDHELMIEAALAGVALAYVWEDRARPYVESGRLLFCLDAWIVPEDWLYLYYPTRKYMPGGLRAVIEMLRVG